MHFFEVFIFKNCNFKQVLTLFVLEILSLNSTIIGAFKENKSNQG